MPVIKVLLGLGSNFNRQTHLSAALDALAEVLVDMRCSPVFESEAVGYSGENFFNLVVKGQTHLSLKQLKSFLKNLEDKNGRMRSDKRSISLDVDILTFAQLTGIHEDLALPRAEILTNAFVLWPLALVAPEDVHPVLNRSYEQLWRDAAITQNLWPVAFSWGEQALTPENLLSKI